MSCPVLFPISDDGGIIGHPAADFPRRCVAGYRGVACSARGLSDPRRPRARRPLLVETSVSGVLAADDMPHRSVKRVAPAVGKGAIAVHLVRAYRGEPT